MVQMLKESGTTIVTSSCALKGILDVCSLGDYSIGDMEYKVKDHNLEEGLLPLTFQIPPPLQDAYQLHKTTLTKVCSR